MIPRSDRMAKVHSDIRGPLYFETCFARSTTFCFARSLV